MIYHIKPSFRHSNNQCMRGSYILWLDTGGTHIKFISDNECLVIFGHLKLNNKFNIRKDAKNLNTLRGR